MLEYLEGTGSRIVGIVDDVHEESSEGESWLANLLSGIAENGPNGAQLVIRTTLPPATWPPACMAALART
jgi:hypothetical protein